MEREVLDFIEKWNLSPFNRNKTQIKNSGRNLFKTKDAKNVYNKAIDLISRNFVFKETEGIFNLLDFTNNPEEIKKRQEYFKSLKEKESSFLNKIKAPREFWSPEYDIVVVTEEDSTFTKLKERGIPVRFLITDSDVIELQEMDIVQVIDCPNFSIALEKLPQAVFLSSIDEAYLERYLRILSGWKENIELIKETECDERIKLIIDELEELIQIINKKEKERITKDRAENALDIIKDKINVKVKEMSISGDSLIEALSKGVLPDSLKTIVRGAIKESGMPEDIFIEGIPVRIDDKELDKILRNQNLNEFADDAERIRRKAKELTNIPKKLREIEKLILLLDFESGIVRWNKNKNFPEIQNHFEIEEGLNEFLDNPKHIRFNLNDNNRASILTGANSGGKTTLLEHIIQMISYMQLGVAIRGKIKCPLFTDVYYFAKNKGSMSKGAFETLLTQMSEIEPGDKTLILADEIEAVTEPGVAGRMISATAEYFINKGCFMVIATHLGQEIKKILPIGARIDGIEAKGLDENNELIVDHNPVLGKLASSTPELIVEKMAKTSDKEYFQYLHNYIRDNKIN